MIGEGPKPLSELKPVFTLVLTAIVLVAVFGTGSRMGHFQYSVEPPATRLAKAAVKLDAVPKLDDEVLERTVRAVLERAAGGDVEAAAFVFELAARQRGNGGAGSDNVSADLE